MFTIFLLSACEPDAGLVCGEGTHEDSGACVVDEDTKETGDTSTGDDTAETAQPDDTADTADTADTGDTTDTADTDDTADPVDTDETGTTTEYDVCGDGTAPYIDIGDAIDDADDGDILLVCPGTYDAVVVGAWSPEVEILGVDGEGSTIIDGGDGPAWSQSEGSFAVAGFTFTGRVADSEGAVHVSGGSLTVSDSAITDVEPNSDATYGYASAFFAADADRIELSHVRMEDNDLDNGTVIVLDSVTDALLANVSVRGNHGAPLSETSDTIEVRNSLFVDNVSSQTLLVYLPGETGSVWAYNNVIADNTYDGPNSGDWTYFLVRGASDVQNTIFARNDGYILQEGGSLEYSVVFGDSAACQGCTWDTNLSADPKLTADYAIDLGFSPCVDAGNPAPGYNDTDGTRNDIGATGGPGA